MKKIVLLFGGFILLLSSCAKDPIPVEPGVATLLSPANDETCLDGTSLNDTQAMWTLVGPQLQMLFLMR